MSTQPAERLTICAVRPGRGAPAPALVVTRPRATRVARALSGSPCVYEVKFEDARQSRCAKHSHRELMPS